METFYLLEKRKFGPERVRFTIEDPRGAALTDKTKKLSHYLTGKDLKHVQLYFKDLGM